MIFIFHKKINKFQTLDYFWTIGLITSFEKNEPNISVTNQLKR